jgi:hypothetical protein
LWTLNSEKILRKVTKCNDVNIWIIELIVHCRASAVEKDDPLGDAEIVNDDSSDLGDDDPTGVDIGMDMTVDC